MDFELELAWCVDDAPPETVGVDVRQAQLCRAFAHCRFAYLVSDGDGGAERDCSCNQETDGLGGGAAGKEEKADGSKRGWYGCDLSEEFEW